VLVLVLIDVGAGCFAKLVLRKEAGEDQWE